MFVVEGTVYLFGVVAQAIMAAQLTAPAAPRAHAPVVAGHPYVASFRTRNSLPSGILGGRMYRDSVGRTRLDFIGASGEEVRFIDDITMKTDFIVYPDGSYEKDSYGPSPSGWFFSNVVPSFTEEHRNILGVDCVRIRFKRPHNMPGSGDLGEAWVSAALGIVMEDVDPSEDFKWEVTEIEFRQPDAGTFYIPEGFQERKEE